MRAAHFSDTHFDERNRLEDLMRVLDAFLEQVADEGVQLILHTGDVFERRSSPAEREAAAEFFRLAAQIAPVVIVKGNHDQPLDPAIFARLATREKIHVAERPGIICAGGFAVWCLPWAEKARIAAEIPEDAEGGVEDAIKAILRRARAELAAQKKDGVPGILAAHAMVAGSEVAGGQRLVGCGVEFTPHVFEEAAPAGYAALGHVHKHQEFCSGRVQYAGSPQRLNFGEPEAKGWVLVDFEGFADAIRTTFVPLPAREMSLLQIDLTRADEWQAEAGAFDAMIRAAWQEGCLRGHLVRLRYRIRAQDLHLVDAEAIENFFYDLHGVEDFKLEALIQYAAEERAPELESASSTWEMLEAFWASRGIDVSDDQRERARRKLSIIEEERDAVVED